MNVDSSNGDPRANGDAVPYGKSCAILVALLVLLSRPLAGAEDNQNGFRVVKERDGDTTTLIIKSDYACEFTVTLEATLKNMTASRPFAVYGGRRGSQLVCVGPAVAGEQAAPVAIQLSLLPATGRPPLLHEQ